MAETMPGAAGGYVAFISYSHKDAKVGRWLHRRLEGYRLPKRLAGTEGEDGIVPARLTPIFRDRDNLPAAGDLSEKVRAALAVSRNLIVICSPNSAASPWVAKEIATFRELHPDRPIFTAIVEGEPGQCFSPALLEGGTEPLAADLRKEGDGRRLGLLKLVAGLAGVGLDALIQRDAQRRIRRVSYVTAAAMIAMLAMGLLTAFALNARAEAQRQRSEAEGLVEFMLTDLRDGLKGVEGLKVLTAVNQRALAYYQRQDLNGLPADSLERRARVLHVMGEDDEKRGNLDNALLLFQAAHQATAAILTRLPEDPQAIFAHGQSEYWIGRVHELRRNWTEAHHQYQLYAAAAAKLNAAQPNNPDYMMEMGWGALNLGIVQLRGFRNPLAAQRELERSIRWFDQAAQQRPNDEKIQRERANAYAWLADTFYARELWPQSLAARRKQHQINERLHRADPNNLEKLHRLAISERSVGRVLAHVGEGRAARTLLLQSHERIQYLTSRDSDNAEWLLLRTKTECDLLRGFALEPLLVQRLRSNLAAAAPRLSAHGNPRAAEVRACLHQYSTRSQ